MEEASWHARVVNNQAVTSPWVESFDPPACRSVGIAEGLRIAAITGSATAQIGMSLINDGVWASRGGEVLSADRRPKVPEFVFDLRTR